MVLESEHTNSAGENPSPEGRGWWAAAVVLVVVIMALLVVIYIQTKREQKTHPTVHPSALIDGRLSSLPPPRHLDFKA